MPVKRQFVFSNPADGNSAIQTHDRHIEFRDVRPWRRLLYDAENGTGAPEENNFDEVDIELFNRLTVEAANYISPAQVPVISTYAGIVPITLSGAIRHVNYSYGINGAFTSGHRDTNQGDEVTPSLRERKRREYIRNNQNPDFQNYMRQVLALAEEQDI